MGRYVFPDGRMLTIQQDPEPPNPRDDDNLGWMVCMHKRYTLGDKHPFRPRDHASWVDVAHSIEQDNEVLAMLPLYLYDHSGITMNTTGFSCKWDSGQVGWIVATPDRARRMGIPLDTPRKRLVEMLRAEVEVYDQFLCGDVYYYTLRDAPECCELCGSQLEAEEDSCGGFYGSDPLANGMSEYLPADIVEMLQAKMYEYFECCG